MMVAGLASVLFGMLGCGDAATANGDRPGTAIVSLMSSDANDGAISLTIRGPGLSTAAAIDSSTTVFSRLASPTELKVIVLGESIATGPLVTLPIGATNRPSAYRVSVDQVAMRSDSLRADISGYQATLDPTPN
jgi:hypothetical protein